MTTLTSTPLAIGGLRQVSAVPNANPVDMVCWVATDRSGRWLFSCHHGSGSAAVHAVRADGSLSPAPRQHLRTTKGCHCVRTTPDNRLAFVACAGVPAEWQGDVEAWVYGNRIFAYTFDEGSGLLTPAGEASHGRHCHFDSKWQ
jgi:hypothetical protein